MKAKLLIIIALVSVGIGFGLAKYFEKQPDPMPQIETKVKSDTTEVLRLRQTIDSLKNIPATIDYRWYSIKDTIRDTVYNFNVEIASLDTILAGKDTLKVEYAGPPVRKFDIWYNPSPDSTIIRTIRDSVFTTKTIVLKDRSIIRPSIGAYLTVDPNGIVAIRPGIGISIDIKNLVDFVKDKWPF